MAARRTNPRETILGVAERLFAARGIDSVSMAQVCQRAGVSNGSLFHFFPTKDALVGALYLRALAAYQGAVVARLERSSGARSGIRGVVIRHVAWVQANPRLAWLIHELRHSDTSRGVEAEIRALNAELMRRVLAWLEPHVKRGRVRRLAPDVLLAVVFGPAYLLTRTALQSGDLVRLRAARAALADAAWAAVASSG